MSLPVECNGILETFVTWEEFESNLRSALRTKARLGASKTVLDIGEGIGFASRCGLITCDWVGAAEGEKLPKTVVLKIPSSLPFRKLNASLPAAQRAFDGDDAMWAKMEGNLRNGSLHNTEVATYDFFAELERLALPRNYYAKYYETVICLEYVENSRMMNLHDNHTVDKLKQVARAIGKIHACSLKNEAYAGMFKGITAADSSNSTKELMEKIYELLPTYYDSNLPVTIHKQMGLRPVVVNGGGDQGDICVRRTCFSTRRPVTALIDWQCTHLGVGVEDLHRITLFALSSEDRRAFPIYSDARRGNYLHLSDLLYPHCALFFVGAAASLITNQEKNPKISDDEKTKRKVVVLDKILGCLVDVLDFDAKNKKHVGNLKF